MSIYICIYIYIVYINIPTKCVDKYLKNVHLPPKLPDQRLPGRARARSRCCAPSCATRSAPWAPPVPQRPRLYQFRIQKRNRVLLVFAMKLLYTYIYIYIYIYISTFVCICMYIYIYYVHKSQCIPFISPWYSMFSWLKLHRRNRIESQQHIDHTWLAHKGRLTGSWVPSQISPQKKDDICGSYMLNIWFIYGWYMVNIWLIYGSYMVNIWLWRYIYSWTSSGWVPSGIFFTKSELENGPVEIVDLPIKNGDFPVRYVNVYQAGYPQKNEDLTLQTKSVFHS